MADIPVIALDTDSKLVSNLMGACQYDETDNAIQAFKILKKRGIQKDLCDTNNWNPLHYAAWFGNVTLLHYFIKFIGGFYKPNIDGNTPLHLAAQKGHIECFKMLWENKPEIQKSKNTTGWNCLHHAADHGYSFIVDYILTSGGIGMVNDYSNQLYTAVQQAALVGRYTCLYLFYFHYPKSFDNDIHGKSVWDILKEQISKEKFLENYQEFYEKHLKS